MAITGLEPWYSCHESFTPKSKTMIVIGAGLAGASMALQAAKRGWTVTVLDRHSAPGQGSSGNAVAVVYPLIAVGSTNPGYALSTLGVECLKKSLEQLRALQQGVDYSFDGILSLALTDADKDRLCAVAANKPGEARYLTPEQASACAGVDLQAPALHILNAGWLRPQAYCAAVLEHGHNVGRLSFYPNVQVAELTRVSQNSNEWVVRTAQGQAFSAEAVVICGGYEASQFMQTQWLPIMQVRGQVDCMNPTHKTAALKLPLCANGYIAPTHAHKNRLHVAGATFNVDSKDPHPSEADSVEIADLVGELGEDFKQLTRADKEQVNSRVSFRSTSPDALPMVGVVPVKDEFMAQYAAYAGGVKYTKAAPVYPGLFTLTGLGARGAVYAPASAQLLMDYIDGAQLHITDRALFAQLHPARFLLRQIKRASH